MVTKIAIDLSVYYKSINYETYSSIIFCKSFILIIILMNKNFIREKKLKSRIDFKF
jgi:hypothetical protein